MLRIRLRAGENVRRSALMKYKRTKRVTMTARLSSAGPRMRGTAGLSTLRRSTRTACASDEVLHTLSFRMSRPSRIRRLSENRGKRRSRRNLRADFLRRKNFAWASTLRKSEEQDGARLSSARQESVRPSREKCRRSPSVPVLSSFCC